MAERTYTNGEINVLWKSPLCTHCEACWQGLPEVFSPDARPWVNMQGATTEKIREQVAQCPSGALTVVEIMTSNPSPEAVKQFEEHQERIRNNFGVDWP
jgi:uncharacterized Fe-S cluster protein YjdI